MLPKNDETKTSTCETAQIRMAPRHHERNVATHISHDITNHPAHQRHAAFTPACFAFSSGTAPRKRQGRANPHGTATSRMYFATRSAYTLEANTIPPIIPLTSDTPRLHQHASPSPKARRHANALPTKAAQIRAALRHHERNFTTRYAYTHITCMMPPIIPLASDTPRLHQHFSSSPVARRHANVKRQVSKTSVSYETSSKSEAPSLQNQRFVRDCLQK